MSFTMSNAELLALLGAGTGLLVGLARWGILRAIHHIDEKFAGLDKRLDGLDKRVSDQSMDIRKLERAYARWSVGSTFE